VAVDSVGNVFVAETNNYTIRKITPAGVVTTVAGLAGTTGNADGQSNAVLFNGPEAVAVDSAGNLIVADTANHTIRFGLEVDVTPAITTQSAAQTVTAGGTITLSVTVTGGNLTYQWRKNGGAIGGATNAMFMIASAQGSDSGSYDVVITNSAGRVTSNAVTLTVNVAPGITTQPVNQAVTAGQPATFTVAATGTPAPTYQWRKDGANISGATSATVTITSAQSGDASSYDVVITNSLGTVTSAAATLTVNLPAGYPAITAQPGLRR
jgi:hypothetical protein